jgi:phage FluMu gp28-like protein
MTLAVEKPLDAPGFYGSGPDAVPAMITFDRSQRRVFDDPARVVVVNFHRQKGKDFVAAAKAVRDAMERGKDWFILSLTQRQADATFRKCRNFARAYMAILKLQGKLEFSEQEFVARDREIDQAFRFTSRTITLPNGGSITSLPGRDPDTLAGLTGNVIFTEFGLFPDGGYAHWSVIFPIATRGFQIVVISTPRGKNTKFYELWRDTETYSVHTCDIYQSVNEEGFVLKDNNGQPCTIERFRRLYNDESKWPREYGVLFTGDLESLIKWAQIEAAAALSEGLEFSFLRVEGGAGWNENFFNRDLRESGRLEFGWDVARTGHISALPVNLRRPGRPTHLRYLVLMHNCTFGMQRHIVRAGMDSARGASVGCGDSTGLGMDSNETLTKLYRDRWEPINFGGSRKRELASALATAFSDEAQTIPSLDGPFKFVGTDLYAIQKDETGGQLALDETENLLLPESHCDVGWGLALARKAGAKTVGTPLPAPLEKKPVGW